MKSISQGDTQKKRWRPAAKVRIPTSTLILFSIDGGGGKHRCTGGTEVEVQSILSGKHASQGGEEFQSRKNRAREVQQSRSAMRKRNTESSKQQKRGR